MVGPWCELVCGEELGLSIVLSKDLLGCILRFGLLQDLVKAIHKHCPWM